MCKKANLLLSLKVKEIMKFFHIYLLFTRTYELKKGDILKSYYIISNQTNLMVFKSRYKQISSNQVFQVVTVDYIGISNIHILQ
jgi:ethanolamine utilization cobalamin adenosyltransferase